MKFNGRFVIFLAPIFFVPTVGNCDDDQIRGLLQQEIGVQIGEQDGCLVIRSSDGATKRVFKFESKHEGGIIQLFPKDQSTTNMFAVIKQIESSDLKADKEGLVGKGSGNVL